MGLSIMGQYDGTVQAEAADEQNLLCDELTYNFSVDGFIPTTVNYGTEFQETGTLLTDNSGRFGVSTVTFDPYEELMWMGNQGGHVTSYYGQGLQKYTSFQVHATQEVRNIHSFNEGILCLTQTDLRCHLRHGISLFTHTSKNMIDMQCMLQYGSRLLIGGHQEEIIDYDLTRSQETGLIHVGQNGCAILRQHSKFICAGNTAGRVDLRDPNTLSIQHTIEAHGGSLSDFDVKGNYLVTCGFSNSLQGLTADNYLMVYDLRQMKALPPVTTMIYPFLLKFLPSYSSRLAVVTSLGQMQLLDTIYADAQPSHTCLYQVATGGAMVTSFDVSATSKCLGFGDEAGSLHLMTTSATDPQFNAFSRPIIFADPIETLETIPITDNSIQLSDVLIMYDDNLLASDLPEEILQTNYRQTAAIDAPILRTMKMQRTTSYASNPQAFRRNQVPYNLEKHRGSVEKLFQNKTIPKKEADNFIAIPKKYRKTEVKYSQNGYDDFDYDKFNLTNFSGLEANLPNNYCNPMLQLLYYCEPIKTALLSHACQKEFCLSCELGFLFHMLDTSRGYPCQAANFLRAFRAIPEAAALGLTLSDLHPVAKEKTSLSKLIQSWNQFILHQIHNEILETGKLELKKEAALTKSEKDTEISHLFGTKQVHIHHCLKCTQESSKQSTMLLVNLIYPELPNPNVEIPFTKIIERSLMPEKVTPAWCDSCKKFTRTLQSRKTTKLPQILALNCGIDSPQEKSFWQTQMDIVQKVINDNNNENPSSSPISTSIKMCRYGTNCIRTGCKFYHIRKDTDPMSQPSSTSMTNSQTNTFVPTNDLYYSNSWIPHCIEISLDNDGKSSVEKLDKINGDIINSKHYNYDAIDEKIIINNLKKNIKIDKLQYTLTAVVCSIDDKTSEEKEKHLVSLIRVGPNYHERSNGSAVSQWYIFNDFSISAITPQEAVWFNLDWKVPCVLYYTAVTSLKSEKFISPLTYNVFDEDKCVTHTDNNIIRDITFTPLTIDEMPTKGQLVGIDSEFVTLHEKETELKSNGKMSITKPSIMSVARITCVRGQGQLEGIPFIDDYIKTKEQVVDYLTKYSGILPGDLDANFSDKHLTTLKSSYQKLRFLIDNGVIFVGHGLKNDFRVINIVVPAEQIIDTVLLFHLPHRRMVSLRFLTWYFFGQQIQSESHDSVEDARAALELYHKYLELEQNNVVNQTLKELYNVGYTLQWKVPES